MPSPREDDVAIEAAASEHVPNRTMVLTSMTAHYYCSNPECYSHPCDWDGWTDLAATPRPTPAASDERVEAARRSSGVSPTIEHELSACEHALAEALGEVDVLRAAEAEAQRELTEARQDRDDFRDQSNFLHAEVERLREPLNDCKIVLGSFPTASWLPDHRRAYEKAAAALAPQEPTEP